MSALPERSSRAVPTFCENVLMHNGLPLHRTSLDLALQCERIRVSGIAAEIKTT